MNKRIKQLAKEAGMYIVDDEFSTYGKFAEKFAELIVLECAWLSTDKTDRTAMFKHFGVKE